MSHTSQAYHPNAHQAVRRPQSAAAVSRHLHRSHGDYTLVHGGRQVRIGPVAFWIVVGTLVVMAIWSIATGSYFAFHEDVLTRLIGRQAEMQFAYEDRIAELRAQIDRITSRQLLDQEQFEQKLGALLHRQTALEQRTNALGGDVTGSIGTVKRPGKAADKQSALDPRDLPASLKSDGIGLYAMLGRVSRAMDNVELRQTAALADAEEHLDSRARSLRNVLADLGVNPIKNPSAAGGPFVPLRIARTGDAAFDKALYHINVARAEINQYTQTLLYVPVRKPVTGEIDMSSPFGMRLDPFLGKPAIHTGIDLRGEYGEPVHVTATGRVSIAGHDGGYGNLVEVDHGNGLATRYGHLSKILVKVGQPVHIGDVIGLIGSTGRSTGPHLHYETRINGEAVDPQKFLRAGMKLGSL